MILSKLRAIAYKAGIEIHRSNLLTDPTKRLAYRLELLGRPAVLDIGANTGQFASGLLIAGYKGQICSFEPLSEAHTELCAKSNRFSQWTIGPRVAIGGSAGEALLNVAGNSVSTSLLDMTDLHVEGAPGSAPVRTESVEVCTIDDILGRIGWADKPSLFAKVDVQGAEKMVLEGMEKSLPRIRGLKMELSLRELYIGQPLFLEMIDILKGSGFDLIDLEPGFRDSRTTELLQLDGTFLCRSFRDLSS